MSGLDPHEVRARLEKLGPRERQIVDLLLQGWDNVAISKEIGMAPRTVKAHMNRLFLKFDIEAEGIKRVKLATLIFRSGHARTVRISHDEPPRAESH